MCILMSPLYYWDCIIKPEMLLTAGMWPWWNVSQVLPDFSSLAFSTTFMICLRKITEILSARCQETLPWLWGTKTCLEVQGHEPSHLLPGRLITRSPWKVYLVIQTKHKNKRSNWNISGYRKQARLSGL